MLYGNPRVSRWHHRLLLALLAAYDTDGIPAGDLMHLAQLPAGVTTVALVRLQVLGWVEMIREPLPDDRRIRYRLTASGVVCARRLLGLNPDPLPRVSEERLSP
jgi:DNA-binding MarR family transcriptional regulator